MNRQTDGLMNYDETEKRAKGKRHQLRCSFWSIPFSHYSLKVVRSISDGLGLVNYESFCILDRDGWVD